MVGEVNSYRRSGGKVIKAMQFIPGMDADVITKFVKCDCNFTNGDGEDVIAMSLVAPDGSDIEVHPDWYICLDENAGSYYVKSPTSFKVTHIGL